MPMSNQSWYNIVSHYWANGISILGLSWAKIVMLSGLNTRNFRLGETSLSTGQVIPMEAYTCELGRERGQFDGLKWILDYPNPCECTRVIIGGLNTRIPKRPFVHMAVDTSLVSENIYEIRDQFNLKCGEEGTFFCRSYVLNHVSCWLPIMGTTVSANQFR